MLAAFPLLKELYCWSNHHLTGNRNSIQKVRRRTYLAKGRITLDIHNALTVLMLLCIWIFLLANKMSQPEKKQRLLEGHHHSNDTVAAGGNDFSPSFGALSVDLLANILGFLPVDNIMCSRRINKKSMEAAKMTTVPPTDFVVNMKSYNAMRVMTSEMPNLQQITIGNLGRGRKWRDGEDPDVERAAIYAPWKTYDIEIISNFRKLRYLTIDDRICGALNGRYLFLFSSFPLLQKLSLQHCNFLKWDLEMLTGLPLLKELDCFCNPLCAGNIISLRVLKDTLEKVRVTAALCVEGNFMDLADFSHLKELNLIGTAVTGDIRDIGEHDFTSLESLILPKGVYGGSFYELQRISDAPDLVRAVYLLKKQRPALRMKYWYGKLSEDSSDWYVSAVDNFTYLPPF
jgi:hypothetical protein